MWFIGLISRITIVDYPALISTLDFWILEEGILRMGKATYSLRSRGDEICRAEMWGICLERRLEAGATGKGRSGEVEQTMLPGPGGYLFACLHLEFLEDIGNMLLSGARFAR